MAKQKADTASLARKIIGDAKKGIFAPVYLLMGEECYWVDLVCEAIVKYALGDDERDFNQSVRYGPDLASIEDLTAECQLYPVFASRRLVVLKDVQNMPLYEQKLEQLVQYCEAPMESTVLVLLLRGKSVDKRRSFYKAVLRHGIVLESPSVRDYEVANWISSYYRSIGLNIAPDAAELMGECTGPDLGRIVMETDKLVKNLPEGTRDVNSTDIEKNVGVSRQFSIFELTKALSCRDASKALRIAARIGTSAKFALPMATAALFNHFYRVLKYEALLARNPMPGAEEKAAALPGVMPFFYKEYDLARSNYPMAKCMGVLAAIEEYDLKGKGGMGESTPADKLLLELTARILS